MVFEIFENFVEKKLNYVILLKKKIMSYSNIATKEQGVNAAHELNAWLRLSSIWFYYNTCIIIAGIEYNKKRMSESRALRTKCKETCKHIVLCKKNTFLIRCNYEKVNK